MTQDHGAKDEIVSECSLVDTGNLPERFPTHLQTAEFWEWLGRTVATYGFLEEILARSIFVITSQKKVDETEWNRARDAWVKKLEKTLTDPLGNLINEFEAAARQTPEISQTYLREIVESMKRAKEVRNVLCHGS